MNIYVLIGYAASLLLLFTNIMFFVTAYTNRKYLNTMQWAMRLLGILPGFLGVLIGIYIFIQSNGGSNGIAIMSAFLILELGTVQLINILKKLSSTNDES